MKLAVDIAGRSSCSVKVGSVIVDRKGRLLMWGWNHQGHDGMGACAEAHCVARSNRNRLNGSTIYVAGFRAKNGNPVTSRPCGSCQRLLQWSGISKAVYLTNLETWEEWVC